MVAGTPHCRPARNDEARSANLNIHSSIVQRERCCAPPERFEKSRRGLYFFSPLNPTRNKFCHSDVSGVFERMSVWTFAASAVHYIRLHSHATRSHARARNQLCYPRDNASTLRSDSFHRIARSLARDYSVSLD